MFKVILAALRTSEFWAFAAMVLMEALKAPVPEEFKLVAPVYIALRVIGKVAQFVFPNPGSANAGWLKNDSAALIMALALSFAAPVMAQEAVPITKVSDRATVMVNGGAMVLTTGEDWSGASLGGTLVYNLHEKFSLFGGYDHGFPVNDVDAHLDLWRAIGNVRIHPNAAVGFGYAWFSEGVEGGVAQLVVYKKVAPRLSVNGLYGHVFAKNELQDFEWARVYLNYQLLGK